MKTIRVFLAIVNTRQGLVVLSGRTEEARTKELYYCCCDWWADELSHIPQPKGQQDTIDLYFEELDGREWCDLEEAVV